MSWRRLRSQCLIVKLLAGWISCPSFYVFNFFGILSYLKYKVVRFCHHWEATRLRCSHFFQAGQDGVIPGSQSPRYQGTEAELFVRVSPNLVERRRSSEGDFRRRRQLRHRVSRQRDREDRRERRWRPHQRVRRRCLLWSGLRLRVSITCRPLCLM